MADRSKIPVLAVLGLSFTDCTDRKPAVEEDPIVGDWVVVRLDEYAFPIIYGEEGEYTARNGMRMTVDPDLDGLLTFYSSVDYMGIQSGYYNASEILVEPLGDNKYRITAVHTPFGPGPEEPYYPHDTEYSPTITTYAVTGYSPTDYNPTYSTDGDTDDTDTDTDGDTDTGTSSSGTSSTGTGTTDTSTGTSTGTTGGVHDVAPTTRPLAPFSRPRLVPAQIDLDCELTSGVLYCARDPASGGPDPELPPDAWLKWKFERPPEEEDDN